MQSGHIYKRHGSWHLRYRVDEIGPDGQPRRREITKRLAAVDDDHRSKKDVEDEAERLLAKAKKGGTAEGSLPVKDFVGRYYLPFILARRTASTHKFYRDTLKNHVTPALGTCASVMLEPFTFRRCSTPSTSLILRFSESRRQPAP